jgi:hypothetical protein
MIALRFDIIRTNSFDALREDIPAMRLNQTQTRAVPPKANMNRLFIKLRETMNFVNFVNFANFAVRRLDPFTYSLSL